MSAVIENERITEADIDVFSYLRQTREEAGCSLEEIAARMDVRVTFLRMLEDGELSRKLGPGYIRSLVVRYGACLGLDSEDLLEAVSRLLEGAHPNELREGRGRRTGTRSALSRRSSPLLVDGGSPQDESVAAEPIEPPQPGKTPPGTDVEPPLSPRQSEAALPEVATSPAATELLEFYASRQAERNEAHAGTRRETAGSGAGRASYPRRVYQSESSGLSSEKGRAVFRTMLAVALLVGMLGVIGTGGLLLGRYLVGGGEAGAGTPASADATVPAPGTPDAEAANSAATPAGPASEAGRTNAAGVDGLGAGNNRQEGEASDRSAAEMSKGEADSGVVGNTAASAGVGTAADSASFSLSLRTLDEVWLEVTGESGEPKYFAGLKQAGDRVTLQAEGPVLIVTGRPEALEMEVNGSPKAVPDEFRWVVSSEGVAAP